MIDWPLTLAEIVAKIKDKGFGEIETAGLDPWEWLYARDYGYDF